MRKPLIPVRLRLPALALVLFMTAAFVRGCLSLRDVQNEEPAAQEEPSITLYDARNEKTVSLKLEEYIFGVVGAEMPASFSIEALKAQAVSARTYAAKRLSACGGKPCGRHGADLCSDSTCCQAWRSRDDLMKQWGQNADFYAAKINEAVQMTAGVVALYGGKPIDALYFSNSGGATEAAQDVFGGDVPYLVSVSSPGEEDSAHYSDSFTYTPKAFVKTLNKAFSKANLKTSDLSGQIAILSRSEGGRVTKLKLGDVTITGREFRSALGLPSADFTITPSKNEVRVDTKGFGHGVGMSQYGANAMAKDGATYAEILQHYYTGITLGMLDEILDG